MAEAFPLIEASGPPRERGRQYGEQAAGRVRLGGEHYTEQLRGLSLGQQDIHALVHEYLPEIERFDPAYIEEMRGIAEGARVEFETIVLLNARTEVLKLGQRPDLRRRLAASGEPEGCTGVVALPQATQSGRLVHAQNWDWKAECAETAVVLHIKRSDGPDILTFTEAGALARSGFNAAGIAITANYLESDRDYRQLGVPLARPGLHPVETPASRVAALAVVHHVAHADGGGAQRHEAGDPDQAQRRDAPPAGPDTPLHVCPDGPGQTVATLSHGLQIDLVEAMHERPSRLIQHTDHGADRLVTPTLAYLAHARRLSSFSRMR